MKKGKKIFVIYNPYTNGYYDGYGFFREILFSKKYSEKKNASLELEKLLDESIGKAFLKVRSFHTV
jgi:hypothetical protein